MAVEWHFKQLHQFNEDEREEVYNLRDSVFSSNGEKDLGHPPMDEVDEYCFHSFGWDEDGLAAYCRVIHEEEGVYRIARVLVPKRMRGKGFGQKLISHTCDRIKEVFDGKMVTLDALEDIHRMYFKVGFNLTGATTDFNGIPAVTMTRNL
ncbi:hypothetical protein EIN_391600 [Entamoeba invadens IP1]|uniref:N-acetyltransferase domain-containing protein n=1 Tax=Entamoeba invadens IP1 TaxID=370355 RepID=A0A0A1U5B9_ENTIV|nr:hypothetical protein EIN_391600 [Entamoeba invadens IP1]ELP89505.1 hypothetical protein EIN_391600 [Entamoeba invadens IP1]|eukprot:XP_004256276.1 hypothetical protein EIN_391600 [Entamoeba invadens IP1]